jgi:AcrR family transcriptional regulator
MIQPSLSPRKKPRQARAQTMVALILEAATRVLAEQSLAGFNTNRVAERAGISVGSLYQYFPNKSALMVALIVREQVALGDAIEGHVRQHASRPLPLWLGGLVEIAIAHQFGDSAHTRYAAALDHEEQRLPVADVLEQARQRILALVQAALRQRRNDLCKPLPKHAAFDCLTITKALVEAEAAQLQPDLTSLKARLMRALLGYLAYAPARGQSTAASCK